jgi:hypothetical protein
MPGMSCENQGANVTPEVPVRRPRHLLDPEDIRGSHLRSIGTQKALTNVQRWVMSVLAVSTILHFAAATALAAVFADQDRLDARIGLNVLAGVCGILAVAAGMLIHEKRPLSPWLLLGTSPALVGAWFTFG